MKEHTEAAMVIGVKSENYVLYSGNFSRVKTFTNFAVLRKVLTMKILIESGGM